MNNSLSDNILEEIFADEKREFAEIDFSSLLDFPSLLPPALSKNRAKISTGEKYIVFHLDEKLFGIRSDSVLEVVPALPVTPLPNIPDWLSGIANLRGTIISVVDLRKLWGKPTFTPQKSRLIVFRAAKNDTSIAFVVDKVSEIVTISTDEIHFSAADFEHSFPTFFGKANFKSQPLFLLDIDKILSSLTLDNLQTH